MKYSITLEGNTIEMAGNPLVIIDHLTKLVPNKSFYYSTSQDEILVLQDMCDDRVYNSMRRQVADFALQEIITKNRYDAELYSEYLIPMLVRYDPDSHLLDLVREHYSRLNA